MDLETAVNAQVGGTPPEEVTELILDACKATKVMNLDKFVNLELLTLNGVGLTSLDGFPALPELKTLELTDNLLADGCLEALQDAALINMSRLSLAGNKFTSLDALEPLSACVNLRDLDLFNCAVTEVEDYREEVFKIIPTLKYLDGTDADDNEKPEDEDEDGEEGDEDLLSSEVGEDEDGDDLGEDDEDDLGLYGEDGEDDGDLGVGDSEDGEEVFDGEEGEDGEESAVEEGEEADDGEEEDEEPPPPEAPASKRQKR